MWKQATTLALSALTCAIFVAACAGGKPIDVDQGDDDDDVATLTTNLAALIAGPWTNETCSSSAACHQGAAPSGGVILGGVAQAQVHDSLRTRPGVVTTANAAASLLLTDPAGTTTHTGGTLWTTADDTYQGTLRWIQQGALNN